MKRFISFLLAVVLLIGISGSSSLQVQAESKYSEEGLAGVYVGLLDSILELDEDGTGFYKEPLNTKLDYRQGFDIEWYISGKRVYVEGVKNFDLYARIRDGYFTLCCDNKDWNTETFTLYDWADSYEDVRPLDTLMQAMGVKKEYVKDLQKDAYKAVRALANDEVDVIDDGDTSELDLSEASGSELAIMNEGFFISGDDEDVFAVCVSETLKFGNDEQRYFCLVYFEEIEKGKKKTLTYEDISLSDFYVNYNECVEEEMSTYAGDSEIEKISLPFGEDFYHVEAEAGTYIIIDSDSRLLTEDDLSGMDSSTLRLARNEIYARHGRKFKAADLQSYFDSMAWYKGTVEADDFKQSMLSEIERANVKTIEAAEAALNGSTDPAPAEEVSYFVFADSSVRLLTEAEVAALDDGSLRLARNEIYARHGRMFKAADLQSYFNSMPWYKGTIPADQFDEGCITQIERKNITLIENEEAVRAGKTPAPVQPASNDVYDLDGFTFTMPDIWQGVCRAEISNNNRTIAIYYGDEFIASYFILNNNEWEGGDPSCFLKRLQELPGDKSLGACVRAFGYDLIEWDICCTYGTPYSDSLMNSLLYLTTGQTFDCNLYKNVRNYALVELATDFIVNTGLSACRLK